MPPPPASEPLFLCRGYPPGGCGSARCPDFNEPYTTVSLALATMAASSAWIGHGGTSLLARWLRRPTQRDDGKSAVGVPRIAAAVLAVKLGVEAVFPVDGLDHAGLLQLADQPVALGIHIRRDVVGHLPGGVAGPDASVEGRGAAPDGPVLISVVPPPEANMMPFARTAGHGLLEGEILFAAEQEQIAHRRIVIGAIKHGIGGNAHAARHGDRICRKPACRMHGPHERVLVADQRDVDRIAGMPVAGLRTALKFGEKWVTAEIDRPELGHDHIGGDDPGECDQQRVLVSIESASLTQKSTLSEVDRGQKVAGGRNRGAYRSSSPLGFSIRTDNEPYTTAIPSSSSVFISSSIFIFVGLRVALVHFSYARS